VKNACSVAVGVGLTAEDVDGFPTSDDNGAADFLTRLGDADRATPGDAVICGLAKVEWLADCAHVTCCGEEIDCVANGIEAAVLHGVVDGGGGDDRRSASSCAVILRVAVHEISTGMANDMDAIAQSDAGVRANKGEWC